MVSENKRRIKESEAQVQSGIHKMLGLSKRRRKINPRTCCAPAETVNSWQRPTRIHCVQLARSRCNNQSYNISPPYSFREGREPMSCKSSNGLRWLNNSIARLAGCTNVIDSQCTSLSTTQCDRARESPSVEYEICS